ncbi:hypothetical protein FRC12_005272 [Ceratobasidium sp. 428]|nr:hypothetical protein FRC12_005272 [Ceratobasidium sp. 428]
MPNAPAIPEPGAGAVVLSRRPSQRSQHDGQGGQGDSPRSTSPSRGDAPRSQVDLRPRLEIARLENERGLREERQQEREYEIQRLKMEVARTKAEADLATAKASQHAAAAQAATAANAGINSAPTNAANAASANKLKALQSSLASMAKLADGTNYSTWSRKLLQHVSSHDLQGYLNGTQAVPDAMDHAATARYRREANMISASMAGLLDDKIYPLFTHLGDLPAPAVLSKNCWCD